MFAQHLSLQSLENPLMLSSHLQYCPVEIASVGSISGSHLKFPMRRTGEGRQVWAGHPKFASCNSAVVCREGEKNHLSNEGFTAGSMG